jgi:hypothetical protein
MSQTTSAFVLTMDFMLRFINNTPVVSKALIGTPVKMKVISDPKAPVPVLDAAGKPVLSTRDQQPLFKYIYNVELINSDKKNDPELKKILAEGVLAERAGDTEKAHEAYNRYRNAITMSFNDFVRNDDPTPQFCRGQLVEGILEEVDGRAGKVLSLKNVHAVKAVMPRTETKIDSLEDLLGDLLPVEASTGDEGKSEENGTVQNALEDLINNTPA